MKPGTLLYLLGISLLSSGTVLYFLMGYYWPWLIIPLVGMALVGLSDKLIWVKLATIALVPVITLVLFFIYIIVYSHYRIE